MAEPIRAVPSTAQAGASVQSKKTPQQSWHTILEALDEAGVLRFMDALLEQRQPLSAQVVKKLDTTPTKQGIKNAIELIMAMGRLPADTVDTLTEALTTGLAHASRTMDESETDKMSVWTAMARLKEPDVARAVNYLFEFLQGFGKHLNRLPD